MDVNTPSTGINQQKLEFTNISNGLGIFSSRFTKPSFSKPIEASTSTDTLACGQYTKHLKFVNATGILLGCN
jgi:hypothetical protein